MPTLDDLNDSAILRELGRRLEAHRLARNLRQTELAELAGVGRSTVQKLEAGGAVQTISLIKVLRALDLLDELDAAIPESIVLPVAELDRLRHPKRRARASSQRASAEEGSKPWTWGDEP
jgi:transcriptional regulator with XRE-family HTH domain